MQEREPQVDWDVVFGEDYEYFDFPDLTTELSSADVSSMIKLAALDTGMRVLDAPCGHGRHGNELAARGYRVLGIDRDKRFIAQASGRAAELGLEVDYQCMDLREMTFRSEFDAAVSWYGSFGYFDDTTDRDILRRYRAALRPGGRFLLDMHSPYRLIPALTAGKGHATYVQRIGNDMAIDVIELDAAASRYYTERITIRGSSHQRGRYCVRMFSAPEILAWFAAAGFAQAKVMDENGDTFSLMSRRLVVLGTA